MAERGELEGLIERAISDNLGYRMAIAIANPKAYESNRDELARILAADIVTRLKAARALRDQP